MFDRKWLAVAPAGYPDASLTPIGRHLSSASRSHRLWLHRPDMLLATATVLLAFGARLAWALYSKAHPTDGRFDRKLRAWEQSYNTVRPHQSLAYRTTKQYLRELAHAGKT